MYTTTYELKREAFAVNSQSIKQAIGIQMTFLLEIKLQKYILKQIITIFLAASVSLLSTC